MVDSYFSKFNTIVYGNNAVVDLTERVTISEAAGSNPLVFYPYDLSNGVRADQLASNYYNDAFRSWLLYLANDIVDPYYQWYMAPNVFNEYLKLKYEVTSVDDLQSKVAYYRNNWYGVPQELSVSAYTSMANTLQKFWQPNYGQTSSPISYKRVEIDWKLSTNKMVTYVTSANTWVNNEVVTVHFMDGNTTTATGQIAYANTTALTLQHISGNPANSSLITGNSYIYGSESETNVIFTDCVLIANNIPDEEIEYWSAVTIYDDENEQNEYNKTIRVLGSQYASQASLELEQLLKD